MRKVNIFFAIGEETLEKDKNEISNFVRNLNDIYEKNNIYFKMTFDSQIDEVVETDLQDSELFIVMFGKEIGKKAEKEFDIAYKYFNNSKNPKIATYVKTTDECGKSALEFMKKLSEELGHYYTPYTDIDTIKLNLVMQINALGFENVQLSTKERKSFNK